MKLDKMDEVKKELKILAESLIKRMRLDLTSLAEDGMSISSMEENPDDAVHEVRAMTSRKWIALPRNLRLSTRPRPPLNPDGSRPRIFARISKSCIMPSLVFNLCSSVELLAERLTEEALLPLFRKLHPEKSGWNLSLVNVCGTNISLTAGSGRDEVGRDIGKMFNRQENVLKAWKLEPIDVESKRHGAEEEQSDEAEASSSIKLDTTLLGSEDASLLTQDSINEKDSWDNEDEVRNLGDECGICGSVMPPYAMVAHERFHALSD